MSPEDLLRDYPWPLRVRTSQFVPEGQIYIINDMDRTTRAPENWQAMTFGEKLEWAAQNRMLVLVRNIPTSENP